MTLVGASEILISKDMCNEFYLILKQSTTSK